MRPAGSKTDLLILLVVATSTMAMAVALPRLREESHEPGQLVSAQGGYPEPPTATPAPTPDESGLLPPPDVVTSTRMINIGESEWAGVLLALRQSLVGQNAAELASYLRPQGVSITSDGAGYSYLSDPNTEAVPIFEDLFQSGSTPVIQGYFVEGCIWVFITGWQGEPEVPTPDGHGFGAPPASALPDPAYMWQVCEGYSPNAPYIDYWHAGDYYEMLIQRYIDLGLSYEDETEIEEWPEYTIITSW